MKRLLVIGFGDVAHRTAALLPFVGWADTLLCCAPLPNEGFTDPRTASLLAALEAGAFYQGASYTSAQAASTGIAADRLPVARESRRLVNRIKDVLRVNLSYPTVFEGVPMKRRAA